MSESSTRFSIESDCQLPGSSSLAKGGGFNLRRNLEMSSGEKTWPVFLTSHLLVNARRLLCSASRHFLDVSRRTALKTFESRSLALTSPKRCNHLSIHACPEALSKRPGILRTCAFFRLNRQ